MATNWVDRVPTYPNRYKVTKEDGSVEHITLERADEPTVVGTPINAEKLNALEKSAAAGLAAMPKTGGTFTGVVYTTEYFHFKIDDTHSMMFGETDGEYVLSIHNNGTWSEIFRLNQDGTFKNTSLMPKSGGTFTGNVTANETKRSGSYLRNIYVKNAADSANVSTSSIKMVRK